MEPDSIYRISHLVSYRDNFTGTQRHIRGAKIPLFEENFKSEKKEFSMEFLYFHHSIVGVYVAVCFVDRKDKVIEKSIQMVAK